MEHKQQAEGENYEKIRTFNQPNNNRGKVKKQ
jgi:hypothetical protein